MLRPPTSNRRISGAGAMRWLLLIGLASLSGSCVFSGFCDRTDSDWFDVAETDLQQPLEDGTSFSIDELVQYMTAHRFEAKDSADGIASVHIEPREPLWASLFMEKQGEQCTWFVAVAEFNTSLLIRFVDGSELRTDADFTGVYYKPYEAPAGRTCQTLRDWHVSSSRRHTSCDPRLCAYWRGPVSVALKVFDGDNLRANLYIQEREVVPEDPEPRVYHLSVIGPSEWTGSGGR